MILKELLDDAPLLLLFLLTIALMIVFIETGYRLARRYDGKPRKPQMAQVRTIMGASLGLLAFMLAFSFSMAQRHYEARTEANLLEISAVDSAYRGADLLGEQNQQTAKELLREFVALRRGAKKATDENDFELVVDKIRQAGQIHDRLWEIAETSMTKEGDSVNASIFVNSVLAMIKAGDQRLQAKLFSRMSPIIWITLFLMSMLSMMIMGYQAGLTGTHSRLATWVLAITFSAVMMLVTDLDRPRVSLFKMDQQLMTELQNKID